MKKKFVATLCAFALAFTLPMAAFAADGDGAAEDPAEENTPVVDDETYDNSFDSTFDEKTDTTTVEIPEGYWEKEIADDEYVQILEKITVEGAQNVKVTPGIADPSAYDEDAYAAYVDWVKQVSKDKGDYMFTVEINGDVTASDHAVVTFQLNADEYGNKVITYYVLHKDGTPQTKTVRVHSDGTVRIWMEDFSIITFMDVEGLTKYENMVEPQDGDLLSPKTGC